MRCAKLLIAHDLSAHADLLLAALLRREIRASQVHLVHVLPRVDPARAAMVWERGDDEVRRASAARRLHGAVSGGPWARAAVHVEIGDPATRIVALAEELGADLVAVATHGRRGLERLTLGSVAEHVARFSPCPVLVLPDAILPAERAPAPVRPATDDDIEEHVEALGVDVCSLVEATPGQLSALQIGLPDGVDEHRFEDNLVRWLGSAGISFVDVAFARTHGTAPRVLQARFEGPPAGP